MCTGLLKVGHGEFWSPVGSVQMNDDWPFPAAEWPMFWASKVVLPVGTPFTIAGELNRSRMIVKGAFT
jgi:hypothetical protein